MKVKDSEKDDFILQILINMLVLLFFSIIPIVFKFSYSLFVLYFLFLIYFLSVMLFKNKGRIDPLINQVTIILGIFVTLGTYFTLKTKTIDSSTALPMIEFSSLVLIIIVLINRKWQVNNFLRRGLLLRYLSIRESFFYYVGNVSGFLILVLFLLLSTLSENYASTMHDTIGEIIIIITSNSINSLLVMGISLSLIIFANYFITPIKPRLPPDFIRPSAYELSGATITDLFNSLSQVFVSERSNGWNGVIQFNILGDSTKFAVYIQNKSCYIKIEQVPHPDITITAWENTFLALLIGKLDPMQAFLNGYLRVDKTNLLMKCLTMFDFQSLPLIVRNTKNSA